MNSLSSSISAKYLEVDWVGDQSREPAKQTPLDNVILGAPALTSVPTLPHHTDDDSELCLNRELSWIGFNYRVLNEARRSRTPLQERLKFLAIVSANIDDFHDETPCCC